MEPKGLRIGNLVRNGIVFGTVEMITRKGFQVNLKNGNSLGNSIWTEFEAIDITEEWLFRFGFVGKANDYFLKESIVLKWGETHTPEDGWLFHYGKSFAYHIKHVHQLQNLYFDLTGEELDIE